MMVELKNVPPSAKFTEAQWRQGTKVEMEHTDDPFGAAAIAAHHLMEHPGYYPALARMERTLEQKGLAEYTPNIGARSVWAVASVLSTALCAYHGYKRNDSVGWAVVWGLLGGLFPVITPVIAYAQGFGEPKRS